MKCFLRIAVALVLVVFMLLSASLTAIAADSQLNIASPIFETEKPQEPQKVLEAPLILKLDNVDGGVEVKWNEIQGASLYNVYFRAEDAQDWSFVGQTEDLSIIHRTVISNTTYFYKVEGIEENGDICQGSSTMPFSIRYIAAPQLVSASVSDEGIKIIWSKVEGAHYYRVMYKANDSKKWLKLKDTDETSFTQVEFKKGVQYTYTVRCLSENKKEFISGYNKSGMKSAYVGTPIISRCKNLLKGVLVEWNAIEGADAYRLFAKEGKKIRIVGTTKDTSFVDKLAKSGVRYKYLVRCISKDYRSYTSEVDTKGFSYTFFSTPVLKEIKIAENGPYIRWNKIDGIKTYQVFYKEDNAKKWTTSKSMIVATNQFVHVKAKPGHTYTYTVACIDQQGHHISYHNTKGVSTYYLDAPEVKATKIGSLVRITWDDIKGADKYRVYYKNADEDSFHFIEDTYNNSYMYSPEEEGFTLQFAVRCIDMNGAFTSGFKPVSVVTSFMHTTTLTDFNYSTHPIQLDAKNRDLAERICMGEAGEYGYKGMVLVAQCLRDTWVKDGYDSIAKILDDYGYDGSTAEAGNAEAKAAVRYIFDEGGAGVQHRIIYFYATRLCHSAFHESQLYVCSCEDTRFFDER